MSKVKFDSKFEFALKFCARGDPKQLVKLLFASYVCNKLANTLVRTAPKYGVFRLTCEIAASKTPNILRDVKIVSSIEFQGESESEIIFWFQYFFVFYFGNHIILFFDPKIEHKINQIPKQIADSESP